MFKLRLPMSGRKAAVYSNILPAKTQYSPCLHSSFYSKGLDASQILLGPFTQQRPVLLQQIIELPLGDLLSGICFPSTVYAIHHILPLRWNCRSQQLLADFSVIVKFNLLHAFQMPGKAGDLKGSTKLKLEFSLQESQKLSFVRDR